MKQIILFGIFTCFCTFFFAQSLHQTELNNHPDSGTELIVSPRPVNPEKNNCELNKMVFGWHPYWMNGAEDNYDWDLISDFCFFGYEVDYATGNATSTHNWLTNDAVDTALVKGKQVHLCVMLFSDHAAFFGNSTARTTLINNLVSTLQTRGAHGINIDFEGVPASQSANLTSFMTDLGAAMHLANPNYKLSICLYAVDWNNVFNETALNTPVDFYTIMGYDYYYSGSSQAGPTDPLYGFTDGYDYSLSRSVSYYLNAGIPKSKLVLGLPYYGKEWETTSNTIPSATTGNNNSSRTYAYVKTNSTGFYTNPIINTRASGRAYVFQNAGTWRQCWISEENEIRERYDLVNRRGLKGIALWTFGYDDGYSELWDAINDKLTNCNSWACSDTLYDEGGPEGNYYNNELVEYTISPPGAVGIDVTFLEFDTEANYDTLWLYDGASSSANLIGAYHGTASPGSFTTTSGNLTLKFKSDGGTRAAGWKMRYICIQDAEDPEVSASIIPAWITEDVTAQIDATDNIAVDKVYWTATSFVNESPVHYQGTSSFGHTYDAFWEQGSWVNYAGTWDIVGGGVYQTDETNGNTSFSLPCPGNGETEFLFDWQASIDGSGTNRRAGMHFMCSDLTLPNRGNSYFVYLRADSDVIQIYEVTNDVFALVESFPFAITPGVMYDITVAYSTVTGEIKVFANYDYVGSWTDLTPLTQSQGVSLRSGNCSFGVQHVAVLLATTGTENVLVGPGGNFYNCNPNLSFPAGKIVTAAIDVNNNLGFYSDDFHVDFTNPEIGIPTEESTDVDTIVYNLNVNFSNLSAQDQNSDVSSIQAEVLHDDGTVIVPLFDVTGSNMSFGLPGLINMQHYSITVYACNGAGLCDSVSSDGFIYINDLTVSENGVEAAQIYPNPAVEKIAIELSKPGVFVVIDAAGRTIKTGNFESGLNWLNIQDWSKGMYHLVIGNSTYSIEKM
jgi:hypothetical protein